MKHEQYPNHVGCKHYINDYYIGFRTISPLRGEHYQGKKFKYHSLVFLLNGEIEFSYDEFINRRFHTGDMFFVPQASTMYGTAIEDSHMLVLTFSNRVETLCDNCTLSRYADKLEGIVYDFRPLPMSVPIKTFTSVMDSYIELNMRCDYLHQLKQRELFVLLQHCYTQEQIVSMFYPVIGKSSFNSWVLENYNLDMTMGDLAMRANMESKSFSRKFSEKFGMTFREFMLKQKVKHIRLRLSMPDATINDIIRDFNFSDKSHFYRFCKENYGCYPKEYMYKLRGESSER